MIRIETGMAAVSLAGHDTGKLYIIVGVDTGYVYLADGELRTCEHPKKKKIKHIQVNHRIFPEAQKILEAEGKLNNKIVKSAIKTYRSTQEV